MVLLEDPQDAEMRKSSREAASQSEPNSWPCDRCCPLERAEYVVSRHALRVPVASSQPNGSHVPKRQY